MSHSHGTLPVEYGNTQPETSGDRVCDKCMVKKRKCNRQRPRCSRCAEDEASCVYSSVKRKPGPAKGSRRKVARLTDLPERIDQLPLPDESQAALSSIESDLLLDVFPSVPAFIEEHLSTAVPTDYTNLTSNASPSPFSVLQTLQQDSVDELLRLFFSSVNMSLQLFDEVTFLEDYRQGFIDGELLVAIVAIASHIHSFLVPGSNHGLDTCLDQILKIADLDDQTTTIPLAKFQEACLLAFYEFHQYPGRKAWLRVGRLTRKAYEYDLHQIDNKDQCQLYNTNVSPGEIEGWRRLWWAIYCLDTYCNIVSFTPFIIERESLNTALTSPTCDGSQLFLPSDTESLWKMVKMVAFGKASTHPIVHIITTTMLREVGKLSRIWRQHKSPTTAKLFSVLDNHLSTIRLALPPWYLDPPRNVLANESHSDHHARLICVLHLNICQLLLSLPHSFNEDDRRWNQGWQATLEHCEDISIVVKHWRAEQCASVDPAICFIISATLMVLHLHYMDQANASSPEFRAKTLSQIELLQLLLEQFSSIWHLARFLIVSFKRFSEMFSATLMPQEIAKILERIPFQLHHSWLKFLSLHPGNLKPPVLQDFDPNLFSETDFLEWDSWASMPTS